MKQALLVLALILALAGSVLADGILIPDFPDVMPIVPVRPVLSLPIEYHRVEITVAGGVAEFSIDQVFRNPNSFDLEATYVFPIPKGAVVSEFALWQDGKKLTSEVLDADKAREIYLDIVRKLRDPGLLEYVNQGAFRARIYPIPAKGEKRVQLKYSQVLDYDAGTFRLHYPLATEKHSPVPLADCSVTVSLEDPRSLASIWSPTHKVEVTRAGHKRATASWEAKDVLPDQDFVLYYSVKQDEVATSLLTYRAPKEPGFFLALISPGLAETEAALPKDVVFVLDTSGSMSGTKIEQAQAALTQCLNSLGEQDRFNLVRFSGEAEALFGKLREVSQQTRKRALDFVAGLEAVGSTNLDEALGMASSSFDRQAGRPCFVLCLTDGMPTAGETDEDTIVANFNKVNKVSKARLFVFGVGYDVNTHLLDKLTSENGGRTTYVTENEEVEQAISSLWMKLARPAMTEVELTFEGAEVFQVYPPEVGDLFWGDQVVVVGRYRQPGEATLVLTGKRGEEAYRHSAKVTFTADAREEKSLPRLWAARRIGYLMDQLRLEGDDTELRDEIIKLAERYGIVTPYTSMLVRESEESLFIGAVPPSPGAVDSYGMAGAGAALENRTGASAVTLGKDLDQAKQQTVVEQPVSESVKQVGDRTFYLIKGIWTDSLYKAQRVTDLVWGSEKYFDLLAAEPELAPYLALGQQVIVVSGDMAYKILPEVD